MSQTQFTLNSTLVGYLTTNGFVNREVDSEKDYYANANGNQIRLDKETKEISILDNRGNNQGTYMTINLSTLEEL